MRCAEGFQRPHFHLTKTLASKLCLTTQRLLRNERVRSNRTGVHFVVHQVAEFQHINNAHRYGLVEGFARLTVIELRAAIFGNACFVQFSNYFGFGSSVKNRRGIFAA